MISFYKYQGTGNDFIIIDDRLQLFPALDSKLIQQLCDRRFGIGADGLILIRSHKLYDFEMKYYNADGFEGSMCGNGGRCAVKFVSDLGLIRNETKFMAVDGLHFATVNSQTISLKMGEVSQFEQINEIDYFINTGSPHFVRFLSENVDFYDVTTEGKAIRNSDKFKEKGTNVNFVSIIDNDLTVRTYERGVEAETFSCGTGVTACALIFMKNQNDFSKPITINTLGGILSVKSNTEMTDIWLTGPAISVFHGFTNI